MPATARSLSIIQLIKATFITRVIIGLLRVEENFPTAKRKPGLTKEQKYSSFFERIFVEFFGMASQILGLYFAQDAAAKLLSRFGSMTRVPGVGKCSSQELQKALAGHLDPELLHNLVFTKIYEPGKLTNAIHSVVEELGEKSGDAIKAFAKFDGKLQGAAMISLAIGVTASALTSGFLTQWLNDNVYSKHVVPKLLHLFHISSEKKPVSLPQNTAESLSVPQLPQVGPNMMPAMPTAVQPGYGFAPYGQTQAIYMSGYPAAPMSPYTANWPYWR